MGIYIKSGSIIPLRLNSLNFTSATNTKYDDIKLEIYLDNDL